MKNIFFSGIFLCFFFSCSSSEAQKEESVVSEVQVDTLKSQRNEEYVSVSTEVPSVPYATQKANISQLKQDLKSKFERNELSMDSISKVFTEVMVEKLIPYWYGTVWDFEGHTNTPGEGFIACGYFVSTTLQHVGININRYKLAQQAPIHEAKSLAMGMNVMVLDTLEFTKAMDFLKSTLDDGLYFIGLSNHVGYLLKKRGELFFLHSSYVAPAKVVVERALDSWPMQVSYVFIISPLSDNEKLMRAWLFNTPVPVVSQ
ncbi:MAG: hypothetical protein ACK4ND_18805 [Cytophagaceae bacterium]